MKTTAAAELMVQEVTETEMEATIIPETAITPEEAAVTPEGAAIAEPAAVQVAAVL